eukprot:15476103-Alexandrium_andersonii.AAC.1
MHFKTASKKWMRRLIVARRSSYLMFWHVLAKHGSLPEAMRRKLTKAQLENRAEMAAVAHHLAEETCDAMPIDRAK